MLKVKQQLNSKKLDLELRHLNLLLVELCCFQISYFFNTFLLL